MSEVRGKCEFCVKLPMMIRSAASCLLCMGNRERTGWRPSAAGHTALKLEADLAAARAESHELKQDLETATDDLEATQNERNVIQHQLDCALSVLQRVREALEQLDNAMGAPYYFEGKFRRGEEAFAKRIRAALDGDSK